MRRLVALAALAAAALATPAHAAGGKTEIWVRVPARQVCDTVGVCVAPPPVCDLNGACVYVPLDWCVMVDENQPSLPRPCAPVGDDIPYPL